MSCALCQLRIALPAQVGVATYLPGASFGPRVLRDYEFVWIVEGQVQYQRGDNSYAAPPGSVILCRPGSSDGFTWDASRRTRHAFFHFDILQTPDAWPPMDQWPLVLGPQEGDVLLTLFKHLLRWGTRAESIVQQLTIMHMLSIYVTGQRAAGDVPREALPDVVANSLKWIARRLEQGGRQPLTLRELARQAQVTPEHLCRLYQKWTGHTPAQTVRLARLDRAAVLLARSNYAVAQIAGLCGFSSPFHFSRRFKDAFGASPRQLRRQLAEGQTPPVPLLKHWGID